MRLVKFRLENYKRAESTDWIEVDDVTALVGGNESGKTAVLQALWKLKPGRENITLDAQDEFPRRRYTRDYVNRKEKSPVVTAVFDVDTKLREKLAGIDETFREIEQVQCTSFYDHRPIVDFIPSINIAPVSFDEVWAVVERAKDQLLNSVVDFSTIESVKVQEASEDGTQPEIWKEPEEIVQEFRAAVSAVSDQALEQIGPEENGEALWRSVLTSFREQLDSLSQFGLQKQLWAKSGKEIDGLLGRPIPEEQIRKAKELVWSEVPVFIYFDDYNVLVLSQVGHEA